MQKQIILIVCLLVTVMAKAQQNVGIGTTTPNASALLDVTANNKGVLIPRVTNAQMNAITTPAVGLLVFNTDSAAFAYRTATAWVFIKGNATASNDWSTKGNAGTDTSKNFIGTTDDKDVVFRRNNIRAGLLSSANTSLGDQSLRVNGTGASNTAIGVNALKANKSGNENTATGTGALYSNTSGTGNTAMGSGALETNSTGNYNTSLGYLSLNTNNGYSNTAIGNNALNKNTNRSNLVAIGDSALFNNASGATTPFQAIGNTAVGSKALYSSTIGSSNTANGYQTLYSNTTGSSNTANGHEALFSNISGYFNVAIGLRALYKNTDRSDLVAIGDSALFNNGTGATLIYEAKNNTAVGSKALYGNTTGYGNAATGNLALYSNTIGGINTANGYYALASNVSGNSNTANGYAALQNNTTANNNTATGTGALALNTIGYSNVAIGIRALYQSADRNYLVAIGDSALFNNGIGATLGFQASLNTAVGSKALYSNTTGSANTANGWHALFSNTTGNNNTAYGLQALNSNTTGFRNTANGQEALTSNTEGNFNTANGFLALSDNTTGVGNTANGQSALASNTQGNSNTANGYQADVITGNLSNATAIGANAQVGLSNSLVLGDTSNVNVGIGTGYPRTAKLVIKAPPGQMGIDLASNDAWAEMRIIRNTLGIADKDLYFGFGGPAGSSLHLFSDGNETMLVKNNLIGVGKTPLTSNNDSRLQVKQQNAQNGIGIESSVNSNHWDFYVTSDAAADLKIYYNGSEKGVFSNINGAYVMASDNRLKKDIVVQEPVLNNLMQLRAFQYHYLDNKSTDNFSNGFMAQDVRKIFPDAVFETGTKNGEKRLGINYQYFTTLAIKGLQEQQQQIQNQEQRIAKLEALVKAIGEKK